MAHTDIEETEQQTRERLSSGIEAVTDARPELVAVEKYAMRSYFPATKDRRTNEELMSLVLERAVAAKRPNKRSISKQIESTDDGHQR